MKKTLLSGAWPKSKAALFEFSEVAQGFTIINSHIAPGNILCFTWGESSIFWPCASLLQCARDSREPGGLQQLCAW